ncbi:MAG: hypothetical protein V3T33_05065, partial [Myxococcota bacterium]
LSFGAMSLPRGGRFDLDASWRGAFVAHRRGHSVDVSETSYDARTGEATTLGVEKRMLEELCRRHLGYAERREDGVHCDWPR